MNCPTCGWPVASAQDAADGTARYADTQGGHNDRHTLVVEAAERAITPPTAEPRPEPSHDEEQR